MTYTRKKSYFRTRPAEKKKPPCYRRLSEGLRWEIRAYFSFFVENVTFPKSFGEW